jgi:hypothetical protein
MAQASRGSIAADCACCGSTLRFAAAGTCTTCAKDNNGEGGLCAICLGNHLRKKAKFESHDARKNSTLEDELLAESGLVNMPSLCTLHPSALVEMRCCDTKCAGALICILCHASAHKNHPVELLDDVAKVVRSELVGAAFAPADGESEETQYTPPPFELTNISDAVEASPLVAATRGVATAVAAEVQELSDNTASAQLAIDTACGVLLAAVSGLQSDLTSRLQVAVKGKVSRLQGDLAEWDGHVEAARTSTRDILRVSTVRHQ